MKSAISLCFFLVLGFLARCYNHASIFIGGRIYFVDADCYSRMSRVRMILEHPFRVIHHQDFENYPQGISSHATAPFDYLIALMAVLLKPFTPDYLDLAGAYVSPLLGVAMIWFLWDWSRRLKLPQSGLMLLFFAICPIIVHGTCLGRPDHQSLEMLCVVVAFGAEWALLQAPSKGWGIVSGAAWGLGLWVSLYEPLVLLILTVILYLVFDRRKLLARERLAGHVVFAGILLLALLVEGWRYSRPDPTLLQYFPNWEKTVGELASIQVRDLYRWVGWGLIAVPFMLVFRFRDDRRVLPSAILFFIVLGLTLWQKRWGYFFGITFAMLLPFLFTGFRKPRNAWIAAGVFLLSLLPVYGEWDEILHPPDKIAAMSDEQNKDMQKLRVVAEYLKTGEPMPVLAPWWYSPEIAYWAGQPAVAGSSHEGMQGIVDSARFYIATDYNESLKILRDHRVKIVIAYDPERVLQTSSVLLGRASDRDRSFGAAIYRGPHSVPPFLKFDISNSAFKVFQVVPEGTE